MTSSPIDEEEFSVFLSREDYEKLKSCRDNYDSLKTEMQKRISVCEESKHGMSQRLQTAMLENGRLKNEKEDAEIWIERIHSIVKERHSQLALTYDQELPKLKNKAFPEKHKPQVQLPQDLSKLVDIETYIEEVFEIFKGVLRIENEKVGNLVKQSMALKQQNLALKEQLSDRVEELRLTKEEKQKTEENLKLQISKLQLEKKQLQQAKFKISKEGKSIIDQQKDQISSLIAQLSQQQNMQQSLTKQSSLLKEQNIRYTKQVRDLQDEIKQYQQHISILKLKEATRKTIPRSSKFEKEDYIKETLVEYMREIRKNLISIGTLSQEEIKQIGASELRTLGKFIQELEEDFQ